MQNANITSKRKSAFFRIFPVPKFLAMPSIGLHISEDAVRYAEIIERRGRLTLGKYGERPLPKGTIQSGEVANAGQLRGVLRLLRGEIGTSFVHIAVPEEKVYLFKTEVPSEGVVSAREFIELRIEENVPLSAADTVFDFERTDQSSGESDHMNVGVAVASKKVVSVFSSILASSGFVVLTAQPESAAMERAVVTKRDEKTYLIVFFGENRTVISVVSEKVPRFSSSIAVGSEAVTKGISRHFSVGLEEAKRIQEIRGYMRNRSNMELLYQMMGLISVVKDEIAKVVSYWQTHREASGASGRKISAILLCGKGSALVGFKEYLSLSLRSRVKYADVWSNILSFEDEIPRMLMDDSLNYATAIGLALTGLI